MKTIPKFPKYSINEDGTQCYNNKTKRFLKAYLGVYKTYSILDDEHTYACRPYSAHVLVALTYLPPPISDKHVWVNHKDGNKSNNHYSNLEWTTISENIQHAYDTGLHKIVNGKDHWNYGKSIGQVTRNRMSRKKLGELHPKFSGWYVVKGVKYGSAQEAHKATRIPRHTIYRRCKSNAKGFQFLPK